MPGPGPPPSAGELDAYRDEADRFIAELDEEYYRHYAGLKDDFELAAIYERHSELTELERARALEGAVDGDAGVRELWRFACEGYLGNLTRELAERVAVVEAGLEATVDGETVPFRMLRPTIANEADRDRRERLEQTRNRLVEEHLNPLHAEEASIVRRRVPDLGSPTYADLFRRFGMQLDELAADCRTLLDSTEELYERAIDPLLRNRVGVGLAEAERWDVARLFRAPEWDSSFPRDRMLPALVGTLADLGISLSEQENVHLDLEARPNKTPRAFCAPIEVPGKVMLVIQPIGGADDWHALFHEAGHTEHFAHTSPSLRMEERRLGDPAVSEGWASLLEHLVDEPAWLGRKLDVPRPVDFYAEGMTKLLYIARRYAAKLLYELEFHSADEPTTLSDRYTELLADALKIEPSPTDYLSDLDSGFYVSGYLRSWAFEAQLRDHLRERFGNAWFASREAGSLLRELWSEGQRPTADGLLREVTGSGLEMEAVSARVREALRP